MSEETTILQALISRDRLNDEGSKVQGIAQLAVDRGYEYLSPLQRRVIDHLLTHRCDGVNDPGDNDNHCNAELSGQEYIESLNSSGYYGAILCLQCQGEEDGYQAHWERVQAE